MLAIKFKRIGKKGQASFRVVVIEKRSKVQGRFAEDLGWFDPKTDKAEINGERALYWMKVGAQPTDSVYNILVKRGVIKGKKRSVHNTKSKSAPEAGAESAAAAPAAAAPAPAGEATAS